jgi:II/X family phage/plasmid replication protein
MIDTTKWQIPINDQILDAVKFKSYETVRTDVFYGFEDKRSLQSQIIINGSKLSVFTYSADSEHIYIEGSCPKLLYGHNIYLFYPSQLPSFLQMIQTELVKFYGIFPGIEFWNLQRLDISYAYKFKTQDEALEMLKLLTTLKYPRKSIHIYPEQSVTWSGRSFSVKWYLKLLEFMKYDYKELQEKGQHDLAEKLKELSTGVLRFEITSRKYNVNQILKQTERTKFTYTDILYIKLYTNYLNKTLSVLFKGANRQTMSDIQVWKNLQCYQSEKAKKLFQFYKMLYSQEPFINNYFMKEAYNPTTIKRNIQLLNQANVDIPDNNAVFNFELSVPNPIAVNVEPPPAVAGEV